MAKSQFTEATHQELKDTIDFAYIDTGEIKFSFYKAELDRCATEIKSAALNIDDEAKLINISYTTVKSIYKSMTEIQVRAYANFGKMLVLHRDRFIETRKKGWAAWANSNFGLKDTSRRHIETLGLLGHHFEKFYFLGKDPLAEFINAFAAMGSIGLTPETIKTGLQKIGFSFKDPLDTDEEKIKFRTKLKELKQYFYGLSKINDAEQYVALIADAAKAGCILDKKATDHINSLQSYSEKNKAIKQMIVSRTSMIVPTSTKMKTRGGPSLDATLAVLIDTIEEFQDLNIYPDRADEGLILEAQKKMSWLQEQMGVGNA